jgi:VanZ family protein
MTRLLRFAFWAAAAFAFTMAVLPNPPHVPGDPPDKVQHIVAFAVLAGLASAAYREAPLLRIGFGLSAFGAVIEIVQLIPALHRWGDVVDWLADTAAAALVLSAAGLWRLRLVKERGRRPGEQQG